MTVKQYKIIRSDKAASDIIDINRYTLKTHGKEAARAYNALLWQAFTDIRDDPFRPGSRERPEIAPGVRSYHIALSRERAASSVGSPRHLILYYLLKEDEIAVSRILHDSRDLIRHLPEADTEQARQFRERRQNPSRDGEDQEQ